MLSQEMFGTRVEIPKRNDRPEAHRVAPCADECEVRSPEEEGMARTLTGVTDQPFRMTRLYDTGCRVAESVPLPGLGNDSKSPRAMPTRKAKPIQNQPKQTSQNELNPSLNGTVKRLKTHRQKPLIEIRTAHRKSQKSRSNRITPNKFKSNGH